MFLMFLPIAPFLIGICVLFLALCSEVASVTGTLTTIMLITLAVVAIVTVILNLTRQASLGEKLMSTITIIGANALSFIVSNNYFAGLNSIASKPGVLAIIDFAFELLLGGALYLVIVAFFMGACAIFLQDMKTTKG